MPEELIRIYLDFFAGFELVCDRAADCFVITSFAQGVLNTKGYTGDWEEFKTNCKPVRVPQRMYLLNHSKIGVLELDDEEPIPSDVLDIEWL